MCYVRSGRHMQSGRTRARSRRQRAGNWSSEKEVRTPAGDADAVSAVWSSDPVAMVKRCFRVRVVGGL